MPSLVAKEITDIKVEHLGKYDLICIYLGVCFIIL